ncbi:MAG: DNA-protecting protein DprA [Candidatus Odyssella sp.]|nr:DNA-protecting protein DprA [Candidatus Odyssella sp.]
MPRAPRALSDAEKLEWIRLARSEGVGPVTFFHLLRFYGGAAKALAALPELARRSGRKAPIRLGTEKDAERELSAVRRAGAQLLAWLEPSYPVPLAAIEDAPPLMTVRGDASLLSKRNIAMVGARNASANGRALAERIARDLGKEAFVVASGLARGIDAAAHRGALESGTVAVLAGGVDICYPPEHKSLYDAIAAAGALVAELPPGTEPLARHFPRRNRVISGLSEGVVVVEAALRSGSLITARLAGEQGREVFAVPGSPLDPRCHGSNNLIRQGAALTESAEDVLRGLGGRRIAPAPAAALAEPDLAPLPPPAEADSDKARVLLIEHLSPSPTAVDELVRQTELPPALVASALLELELAGRIERHPGNRVARLGT